MLNEIRHTKMTLSQQRLFSIYLSKINPKDETSREVIFRLDDYAKIMSLGRLNIKQLKKSAYDLTRLVITFCEDGEQSEYTAKYGNLNAFSISSTLLFERFKLHKDDNEDWVVSIRCTDKVMPLMFNLQKFYFKYKLWNALQLTSSNQIRIYELLKQYETIGYKEIDVKDLRERLGFEGNEYKEWSDFRRRVLEASQVALKNYTDIKFTWEVIGKRGNGGKINTLRFNVEKNDGYVSQLTFDEFLLEQMQPKYDNVTEGFEQAGVSDIILFLTEACENEFKPEEIQILHNLIIKIIPYGDKAEIKHYNYLKQKYDELNWRAARTQIKNRFGYLKKIIEVDLDESINVT